MRLIDLKEMALRGGKLRAMADDWAQRLEKQVAKEQHLHKVVGKIDGLEVRQHLFTVTVWDESSLVAACRVDKITNSSCVIDDIWVRSDRAGQKMLVKLLLFLKNERRFTKIMLGNVHSDETYDLLKAGGLKSFKKSWENRFGTERKEFSPETIDQFYGSTDWKLVLENTEDLRSFVIEGSFTRSYMALANLCDMHEVLEDRI